MHAHRVRRRRARTPTSPNADQHTLTARVLDDLRTLLGARGEPTFRAFHLWPKAIPQYDLGYGRFKDIMDEVERRNPGLALAGSYRDGVALGEAIASGEQAAARLAAPLAVAGPRRPVSAARFASAPGAARSRSGRPSGCARCSPPPGTRPSGSRSAPPATWCRTCRSPRSAAARSSPNRSTTRCSTAGSTSPCTRSRISRPQLPDGIALGAVGEREDPRDALVGRGPVRWDDLPAGRGASPPAASAAGRSCCTSGPISRCVDIRGNVDTRLAKLDAQPEWSAILLAAAGLVRLGLGAPDRRATAARA